MPIDYINLTCGGLDIRVKTYKKIVSVVIWAGTERYTEQVRSSPHITGEGIITRALKIFLDKNPQYKAFVEMDNDGFVLKPTHRLQGYVSLEGLDIGGQHDTSQ